MIVKMTSDCDAVIASSKHDN